MVKNNVLVLTPAMMKNKTNIFRKLIFAYAIIFSSSWSFSQINFNDKILQFYDEIARHSNYLEIVPALEKAGYKLKLRDKKVEGIEILTFALTEINDCVIAFAENKKLIYIKIIFRIDQGAANSCVPNLVENRFVQSFEFRKDTESKIGLKYTNEDYPYEFSLWSIGDYNEGIFLFNPEFGRLDKYINYDIELIVHGDPFKNDVRDLYKITGANGKIGYINRTGKEIIEPIYDDALEFSEGLAVVSLNKKFGFINQSGTIVIPIDFDEANSFSRGIALVKMGLNYNFIYHPSTVDVDIKYDFTNIAESLYQNLFNKYFVDGLSACYGIEKVSISLAGEIMFLGQDKKCNKCISIKNATIKTGEQKVIIVNAETNLDFTIYVENPDVVSKILNDLKNILENF
jgi:WG containing repeat